MENELKLDGQEKREKINPVLMIEATPVISFGGYLL